MEDAVAFEVFWTSHDKAIGAALAEYRRHVLGIASYSDFAVLHGVSPRTVMLLEKYNRVPKRADVLARLERAYGLPEGFLGQFAHSDRSGNAAAQR